MTADHLSKLAMGPMDGSLHYSESLDESIIDSGSINTF